MQNFVVFIKRWGVRMNKREWGILNISTYFPRMVVVSDRAIKFFEFCLVCKNIQAITVWPFIIVPSRTKMNKVLLNHERIHLRQQLELLIIPSFVWYFVESLFRNYSSISFEREAFTNEKDLDYLKTRKWFAFMKYF